MSDMTSLAQALAKLDEAMRPGPGGSADPSRRRVAQRLAELARCEDAALPAFAKRHMPGRTAPESELRAARDLLLAIGGIADMEEGGPEAWAALAEVKPLLERRLAEAKEAALRRKAEAEDTGSGKDEKGADGVDATAPSGTTEPVAGPWPGGDIPKAPSYLVPPGVAQKPPELLSSILPAEESAAPPVRVVEAAEPREPVSESPVTLEPARGPAVAGAFDDESTGIFKYPAPTRPALPFSSPDLPAAQTPLPAVSEPPKSERPVLPFSAPGLQAAQTPLPAVSEPPKSERPVLPFSAPGLPAAQVPRQAVSEPPKSEPRPRAAADPLGTTGEMQAPMTSVLPFRPATAHGARPPPPPLPPPAPPSVRPATRMFFADPLSLLSLAQYASLCAELTVFPEGAEGIFRRYGLDSDEKRAAVDAAWKERLRNDPEVYEAWQELYRRYHAHWAKQGTAPQSSR